ncbi:hypothetical protein B0H14DRAFT_3635500 [Mycena olivaceomarginata]|nr:hypothetical protein B0H14DRAFT_3635500 [Mycena olivaceomarginata]
MVTCASHHAYFASILFLPLNLHTRPSEALQPCHPGLYGQVISRPLRVCRLEFDDDKQPIKETSKVVHTGIIGMCVRARTRPHPRLHPRRAFPTAPTGALTSPGPVVLTITEVFPNPCRQSGEGSRGLEYLLRERLQPSIQPSRSSVPIQRPQPPPLLAHLGADYRCSTERRGQWTTSPTQVLDAAPRGRTTTTCAFLGNIQQTPCDPRWWRPAAIAQVPFHESDLYATLDTLASAAAGLGGRLSDLDCFAAYADAGRILEMRAEEHLPALQKTHLLHLHDMALLRRYLPLLRFAGPPPPASQIFPQALLAYPEDTPSMMMSVTRPIYVLDGQLLLRSDVSGSRLHTAMTVPAGLDKSFGSSSLATDRFLSAGLCPSVAERTNGRTPFRHCCLLLAIHAVTDNPNLLMTPFTGPISLATALLASDLKSGYTFRPRHKPRKSLLELDCYICTCLRYIVTDNILVTDFCRMGHSFIIVLGASSHSLPAGPTAQVV